LGRKFSRVLREFLRPGIRNDDADKKDLSRRLGLGWPRRNPLGIFATKTLSVQARLAQGKISLFTIWNGAMNTGSKVTTLDTKSKLAANSQKPKRAKRLKFKSSKWYEEAARSLGITKESSRKSY
jgi:hypothetical protein